VLTRTSNTGWGPCINQRAAIGNNAHADAAVSIHADGGPSSGRGFQILYPPASGITAPIAGPSQRLAHDLQAALVGAGVQPANYAGTGDGLIARSDLGGLNLSQVPKDFVECGNMRNSSDAALLTSAAFQQRLANAIASALAAFVGGR
jgi:N-acetylmuramoyl-L-alanine amidase